MEITIARVSNVKPDKNGNPISNILTSENKWLNIMGIDLTGKVGAVVEIDPPKQFGKGYYAKYKAILSSPDNPPSPPKYPAQGPTATPPMPSNSHAGKVSYEVYINAAFDALYILMKRADEEKIQIDPQVLGTLVGGLMIGIREGRVELPDNLSDETPF